MIDNIDSMASSINKFADKKLLLLGSSVGTYDIVNYARSQGAYVIVTDNQPIEKSAAKQIADEAWPISTADVDTLEKLAVQHKVNGIFAGVSDFNLEKALTLCERLGFPFYCTRQQWETCNNKQSFKQLCRDNEIPVVKEYKIDNNYGPEDLRQIKYPVIVKPVDRSAGQGIRVCRNEAEFLKVYSRAISTSKTAAAIVEDFVEGDEIGAGYTIKNGQFSLTYVTDRYTLPEISEYMPLPQANILPSKHTHEYTEDLNIKVIKMFQSIHLTDGFIFVQGKMNSEGFRLFEANYRIDAALRCRLISRINKINYLEMLTNYSITGKMEGYDLSLDNYNLSKCCVSLNVLSRGGRVGKITGLEDIQNKRSLVAFDKMYEVGDYIEQSGTLGQIHLRFVLIEDTLQELKNSIREIQDTVKVLNDRGVDMCLPPFITDRI